MSDAEAGGHGVANQIRQRGNIANTVPELPVLRNPEWLRHLLRHV
jgi:hypothetical protein